MDWQPMETAPKDGTRVLGWDHSQVRIVYWDNDAWISGDPQFIEQHLVKWHPLVPFYRDPIDRELVHCEGGPGLSFPKTPDGLISQRVALLNKGILFEEMLAALRAANTLIAIGESSENVHTISNISETVRVAIARAEVLETDQPGN